LPRPGRQFTVMDRLIGSLDKGLRVLAGRPAGTGRRPPGSTAPDFALSEMAKRRSVALMRVNHAGEVAAQALYQGQALAARDGALRKNLERAAAEEDDHLTWCRGRLEELGGRPSYLDPLWYGGSLCIGIGAGLAGDRWSLGFVAETEHRVAAHLEGHLSRLPEQDRRSRAIVRQMRADEQAHALGAEEAGGVPLPRPVKRAMALAAKVMTGTAYWI